MTPCLTMLLLPQTLQDHPQPSEPPPPGMGKAGRDVYALTNEALSENFAVRWGEDGSVDEEDVALVLEALETSWAVEVTELGMPQPEGSASWLFNVYIGDTDDAAPSGYGVSGYYTTDTAGWPMIVLSQSTVAAAAQTISTVPHELFHALQHASVSYGYGEDAGWYWESTASWMEAEVFPDDPNYAVFLFGFAYLPHYPLSFYDYYDTGEFQELYAYGAFIFPRLLSEKIADPALIIDTWLAPGDTDDPLVPLAEGLAARGSSLDEAVVSLAMHDATWDYIDGDIYANDLDTFATYPDYAPYDQRVAAEVPAGGTGGWVLPPATTLPGRYGYNVIAVPEEAPLWVSFAGEETGSAGTPVRWAVGAVRQDGAEREYFTMNMESGTMEVSGDGAWWLVVTALADESLDGETFDYTYAVDIAPLEHARGDDTGGEEEEGAAPACGCGAGGGGAGLWLVGLAGLIRRRGASGR